VKELLDLKCLYPSRFALSMTMTAALLLPAMHADEQIQDRKQNQQARIAQGMKSGRLTANETASSPW
jgi:hypothetical protein